MPSAPRVVVPGAPHHVYLRGNNRRRLFTSVADRMRMLGCVRLGLKKTGCQLHQLTLMTNHVHMVITPLEPPALASFVQRTNQRYAQIRNMSRGASGKLFEERYRSEPILDDAYLMTATLYADSNSYYVGRSVGPSEDEWSTGPLHSGLGRSRITADMWTPSVWYLGLAATPAARALAYRAAMVSYVAGKRVYLVDEEIERADELRERRRISRPDGSSAREPKAPWRLKQKRSR